jgi:hypothetical protein
MTMNTTFLKDKEMLELAYLLERVETYEGGISLPPQLSCGGLKEGSDEKSSQTQPTLALIRKKNQSTREIRRKIPRGVNQTRHPLFVTSTRREAITLRVFGMQRHVISMGINTILMKLVGRSKPYATRLIILRGKGQEHFSGPK